MNKKFSTLMALALLAGSFPVAAQVCPQDGEIPYRTRMVNAAAFDEGFSGVKEINENYWYQLEVDYTSANASEQASGKYVLTAERDYSTGKVYLTYRKVEDAALTHSLWKIVKSPVEVNGRRFYFENKETGFKLTFDHQNALQVNSSGAVDPAAKANANWKFLQDGLMDGCNSWWDLYTTDTQSSEFDYSRVYSYFHNADSVMYLASADKLSSITITDSDKKRAGVDKNLYDNSNVVVVVKDSKANAGDYAQKANLALKIKPVVAGAKVLSAAEINTMIDADGSFLSFPGWIRNYSEWADAENGDKKGNKAKFTVINPETGAALNLATNPLGNTFEAENSPYYDLLKRENYAASASWSGSNNPANYYAGYDVLLKVKDPKEINGEKYYQYLTVSEKMYDGIAIGNYTGLEVKTDYYAYIDYDGTQGSSNVDKNKRVYINKADKSVDTPNWPDALEARYHWKVTYYPTNDSLVFEPLNASRMSQAEYSENLNIENTHLANASSEYYFNTVNEGLDYVSGWETNPNAKNYNAMYEKAEGVPVALYAMNFSDPADNKAVLTVGVADGKGVDATNSDYAAVCKFNKTVYETKTGAAQTNPAYVTNGTVDYQAAMNLRVKFDHDYTALIRGSQENGVYFVNLVTGVNSNKYTEKRVNGSYLVADMAGHVVYDVLDEGEQDFTHMPATQWVVERYGCEETGGVNVNEAPTVRVYNREFRDLAFEGQLYVDKDNKDNFYIINHRDYSWNNNNEEVSNHHLDTKFSCSDTIKFTKIEANTLGYLNLDSVARAENYYQLQHIYNKNGGLMLGTDETNVLKLMETETVGFEFFTVKVPDFSQLTYEEFNTATGKTEVKKGNMYTATLSDSVKYGLTSEKANAPQLYKSFYKIKVKDKNQIDNDHLFIAFDNQHNYVIAKESDIAAGKDGLAFAVFQVKENNCINGLHYYALVNTTNYDFYYTFANKDLKVVNNLRKGYTPELGDFYFLKKGDNYKVSEGEYTAYNEKDGDQIVFTLKNDNQFTGKLGISSVNMTAKFDDLCGTISDVFAVVSASRPVYATLADEYVNNSNKAIDLRTIERQGNESLFEDSSSNEAKRWSMNYLGAENMTLPTNNEGFYVDAVAKSMNTRMPQYLLAVAADSVPAYTYCNVTIDDRVNHGINHSCGHGEWFPGYVEGRFLVNFNDSIQSALIDKVTNADKFKSDNYTRLGFVEAVHRGDSLYVLKYPYTLESIKEASKDASENGKMYINPLFLSEDSLGKVYDIVPLDGKHNNAVFSFRNTGDAEGSFLIESNDAANKDGKPYSLYSAVGSYAGAWIKIHNNVPVLAKYYNDNGSHNTGDFTDDWVAQGDKTDDNTTGEFINQGARFVFNAIDKDSQATANETIAASSVIVAGQDGAVVVKGAEGKNVIVSTILGKVVANEVLTSDNAQIAAPQGVVVVSVDGESFKVVVK